MSIGQENGNHRTGFVAVGGRPNVGKSTLVNRLVGRKVAIVTPKPQTTRRRIVGIRNEPDAQMILVDTPGLQAHRGLLNEKMTRLARRCLAEGEVVMGVIEAASDLGPEERAFLAEMGRLKSPLVAVINKIDLISRAGLIVFADQCHQALPQAEIVPVSALTGENLEELIHTLKSLLPPGPALLPEDQYTDQTERAIAEEIIREKLFLETRQEVPFSIAVKVEQFVEEPERRLVRISALIMVERESQKGIVIGAGGRILKEVGTAARRELEQILGTRLFLELIVKVEHNWTRDPKKLKELGLWA